MERIDIAQLTPEYLFQEHISKRMPLVISGVPADNDFKAYEKWTDIRYLKKTAGEAKVKVEPMHAAKKQYGTDVERVSTTFGSFLDSLQVDSETYNYLTTQYDDNVGLDDSDVVAAQAFPEPVRSLIHDLPMAPKIMGNLALQQMNLWVGKSKEGASSGLHHDFHDNLYILLKGRKRFVLFPPEMAKHSKPFGELGRIHDNGLIVYKPGQEVADNDGIRPDGLSERDAAGLRVKALEKKMDQLREAEGNEEELEALEEIYDEAVENMMDFAIEEAQGDDFDEDDGDDVDEDEELDGLMEKIGEHIKADSSAGQKRKAADELTGSKSKAVKGDDDQDDEGEEEDEEDDQGNGFDDFEDSEDEDGLTLPGSKAKAFPEPPSEPLSFSQIPTQELHQHLGLKQPKKQSVALSKAPKPLIVELNAGEMLYLPTSWWHEVTSFSNAEETQLSDKKGKGKAKSTDDYIHMALNYWFHPPDQLDNAEKPYTDDLVWNYLRDELRANYNGLVCHARDL